MKKNTMRAIYRSHCVFKSLPQCSWIAPTVFLNRSHSVFKSLPQCFQIAPIVFFRRMKHESKNETYTIYVSSIEYIDYQRIKL